MKAGLVKSEDLLGHGVYRIADVARYAEISPGRARSWFTTRADRKVIPVFVSDFPRMEGGHFVSFLDLIDTAVAGKLREAGVPMRKIRAAYAYLQDKSGLKHPFAHCNIYTDGREIITDAAVGLNDGDLQEIVSGQGIFREVRKVLKRIEYSTSTGMAERWPISDDVVIDPKVGFGQPVVEGTGISTYVIARAYAANENDATLVAGLYGITARKVERAAHFEARFSRRAIA